MRDPFATPWYYEGFEEFMLTNPDRIFRYWVYKHTPATYVMSDIHGWDTRYRSVLKQIKLKKRDHLYILGDVIDHFPDGLGILRETMKKENITLLMGNHEHMMLEALTEPGGREEMQRWYWNGGDITHDKFKHCTKVYREEVLE